MLLHRGVDVNAVDSVRKSLFNILYDIRKLLYGNNFSIGWMECADVSRRQRTRGHPSNAGYCWSEFEHSSKRKYQHLCILASVSEQMPVQTFGFFETYANRSTNFLCALG